MRDELLRAATPVQFKAKDVLIHEGDRAAHVLLLLSGFAKVTAALENGHESLLAIRVGGDIVGEMAAMDNAPRSATVTACGSIAARVIRQGDLRAFMARHPKAGVALTGIVADRLRWANRRRLEFRGYPAKVRLARVLVELAVAYGTRARQGLDIKVTLTQPELAALTGSAEVTIHKALRELRDDRLLDTGYGSTTILDLARLRVVAHLPAEREGQH